MTTMDDIMKIQADIDYRSRIIDFNTAYPEIKFLLNCNGVGIMPSGDIFVIKGKAKTGKSHAIVCLITALLRGNFANLQSIKPNHKILYIDCEMNPCNTVNLAEKVSKLCGFDLKAENPHFTVMNLRSDDPISREQLIEQAITKIRPDVVFIDGIKDLITTEINDQTEAGRVVQTLMKWTREFEISIVTVLHENKKDTFLRGAIGTEIHNKSAEVWQVTKDNNFFIMEQTDSRNKPTEGFSFSINEDGLPLEAVMSSKSTPETKEQKLHTLFAECLSEKPLSYRDLKNAYMDIKGCKTGAAENAIRDANKAQIILKKDDLYCINDSMPNS